MDNIRKVLAQNIKTARKAKGWTQADLAVASGVSFRGIQDIETAKRGPRPETLAAIAGALGVGETSLYRGSESQTFISEDIGAELELPPAALKAINQAIEKAVKESLGGMIGKPEGTFLKPTGQPKQQLTPREELVLLIVDGLPLTRVRTLLSLLRKEISQPPVNQSEIPNGRRAK